MLWLGLSLEKGERLLFNSEDVPERMDTGVGRLNNAQALFTALTIRWTCVGAECNTDKYKIQVEGKHKLLL